MRPAFTRSAPNSALLFSLGGGCGGTFLPSGGLLLRGGFGGDGIGRRIVVQIFGLVAFDRTARDGFGFAVRRRGIARVLAIGLGLVVVFDVDDVDRDLAFGARANDRRDALRVR
jgi:hypothetical protein